MDMGHVCVSVCTIKLLEFLHCVYVSHWKELSVGMDHSLAVQRWVDVWVQPALDLLTSNETLRSHKSRLSDVCNTFLCHHTCGLSAFVRGRHIN